MGMYDYVRCHKELPWPEAAAFEFEWQTKSTPHPQLHNWEIRADGTLWHEEVDYEDRSDKNAPKGSFASILGMMTPVNPRWVQVPWDGEFEIHHLVQHEERPGHWWYEVIFWFRDGVVRDVITSKRDSMPVAAEATTP
jgi:hypothetical protein